MNTLDEALKTFIIWKGLAHVAFAGYTGLTFYLVYAAFHAADLSPTKAGLVGSMVTVGLPLMLNWYITVMSVTSREKD